MRRFTRTVAAAALATALAVTAGCTGSDNSQESNDPGAKSLEKVTYLTGFGSFGREAYAWVAKEKGFFKEAGFDVEIQPGKGSLAVIQTVVGEQADFGVIDMTGGLLAKGKDKSSEFVVVAAIHQRTMTAIIALEGSGIGNPKDLEGKKVADTPGSVVRNLFPTYAKLAGVDASKVTWINGQPQTLMGTLASGSVDAIGQFVVGKPTVETVAKGKKAVLLPYSDVITDLYGNGLITTVKAAKEDPERVKRFREALLKGLEYSIANPKEAAEILKKYEAQTKVEAAAAELELMAAFVKSAGSGEAIGSLDPSRVARSIAILAGAGAIPAGLTPEEFIDFNVAPKV